MKIFLILIFSMFIVGCEQPPTLKEMKVTFENNIDTFSEIKSFVCELGKVEQLFSYYDGSFTYSTNVPKRENEPTIQYLDERLSEVGVSYITFKKGKEVTCTLRLDAFQAGFAGSGVFYYYKYNPIEPTIVKKSISELDSKSVLPDSLDISLSDGWYLSYRGY